MALIVEDGTGKTDAESFLSVADADTYDTNFVGDTTWGAANTSAKEIALRTATQYLDTKYRNRWRGRRKTELQALGWPRSDGVDDDDYVISSTIVPKGVEDSTAVLAIEAASGSLYTDETTPGGVKRTRDKVDVLETEIEYSGSASQQKKFTTAENLLTGLIDSGNEILRS